MSQQLVWEQQLPVPPPFSGFIEVAQLLPVVVPRPEVAEAASFSRSWPSSLGWPSPASSSFASWDSSSSAGHLPGAVVDRGNRKLACC